MAEDHLPRKVWGVEALQRLGTGTHHRHETPPEAGRRCRQPHVHLHREACRLPDGEGGDDGKGDIITPYEYASR